MEVHDNNTMDVMLLLLKASLQEAEPCLEQDADWQELFGVARQHGVVTLLYDAILRLPPERQPQGDMALSWALSAERTRHHFAHQAEVLHTLAQRSKEAGLPMLVLKGMDLARLYPVPDSRACGDIDVYFFDRYAEGNALLGDACAALDGKHAEVKVDGVPVENHLTFLDQVYRSQRRAEQYIVSTLPQATPDAEGVYHLAPMGAMVYLLMHTVSHLTGKYKMPLRNVLDWGLFLDAHRAELPPRECRQVVRRLGMSDAFAALTSLAIDFTGRDLQQYVARRVDPDGLGRLRSLILKKDYLPHVPEELPFFEQLTLRIQRYRSRHWLYRYLPASRAERIENTLRQQWRRVVR